MSRLHQTEFDFTSLAELIPLRKADTVQMNIAKALVASGKSDCTRRQYGTVIISPDNRVVATGYNAPPRGELSTVQRYILEHGGPPSPGIPFPCCKNPTDPHGSCYNQCNALHSEHNALMQIGTDNPYRHVDLYLAGRDGHTGLLIDSNPCIMCARDIKNFNVLNIYCLQSNGDILILNKEDLETTA